MIKRYLLALLVMLSFGITSYSQDDPNAVQYGLVNEYEIGGIQIEGNKYLDGNALISLTGLKVGDRIKVPGESLSGAIKKVWKHGLVADAGIYQEKIEEGKIYLVLLVKERPRMSKFEFSGINRTQKSDLNEALTLYRGKVLTDAILKNTENTVKQHFIDKGFLNCEIDIRQVEDTILSNHVRLNIKVKKNAKVKIDRINIIGADLVAEQKIKRKMKNTKERVRFSLFSDLFYRLFHLNVKSFLTESKDMSNGVFTDYISRHVNLNFFKTSKYIASDFREDKVSLLQFMNSKGFRDAVIVTDSVYRTGESTISLDVKIEEGKKYYFRNIAWSGNYVYSDDQLSNILGIKAGDIYDMEDLNSRLTMNPQGTDITGLYMDDGYLFFNIRPVEVGIVGDSIDIEMRIFEGAQATINNVIITGNDRTNEHVIRRELRTLPGQKFSRSNIIRDQQQLAQMGYFDPEQISINPVPNPADNTVDIEYGLVEKPSDQIELSGGWGGFYGFVGTLGLTFNNFSVRNIPHFDKWRPLPVGDGQKLSVRAQANGKQFQSYTLMFSEPWLGGKKPTSFTFSLNSSIQDYTSMPSYIGYYSSGGKLKVHSATVGIGKRLKWPDNYFTLSTSLSYKVYQLEDYSYGGSSLGFTSGTATTPLLTIQLARSSIDNPMYPASGSSISIATSFTPPFSKWRDIDYATAPAEEKFKWVEYTKYMFDFKHHVTLVDKLVLATNAHLGFMNTYSPGRVEVGPFERFQLGGDGLAGQNYILGTDIIGLRGYENLSIKPDEQYNTTYSGLRGGIIYSKYSMELRYPVTTGQAATIYLFLFGEAGNNWDNYQQFNPFDVYKSAGMGARLFMPAFGLIGLNWGYGFDTLPSTDAPSGMQFHFTIGQQLR
ncbi:MAG: POTRA domain-containing protein [Bacteroidota bacterium]